MPAFSLVVTSRGNSLVDMHGFLIIVASLVVEDRLWGSGLQQFRLPFSIAQARWFTCLGLVVPWLVGSSWTGDQTGISYVGRLTLYYQASRESPFFNLKLHLFIVCS